MVQVLWKADWQFLKKLNIELPYDPVIPLLSRDPKELKTDIQTKIYTQMFITALFTLVKRWKLSKCSSTGKWINKVWHIHSIEHYSAIKKE